MLDDFWIAGLTSKVVRKAWRQRRSYRLMQRRTAQVRIDEQNFALLFPRDRLGQVCGYERLSLGGQRACHQYPLERHCLSHLVKAAAQGSELLRARSMFIRRREHHRP